MRNSTFEPNIAQYNYTSYSIFLTCIQDSWLNGFKFVTDFKLMIIDV